MPKNIVICCDGTGNEFSETRTNVIKLFTTLIVDPQRQIMFYDPGLGTMSSPYALTWVERAVTKLLGLAIGFGFTQKLTDAYRFLMDHFEDGDQVYLFGFSRGAYTVRALAGLLHELGLLRDGNVPLIPYAIKLLEQVTAQHKKLWPDFQATFSRVCKPHFVGVWDTVNSVGWFVDPVSIPGTHFNPDIAVVRHAISIDERRAYFRQNLLAQANHQNMKQVWFAGVHSDVGGGYPEQQSGLAKITLAWMLREAKAAGLLVDEVQEKLVLGQSGGGYVAPSATGPMHSSLTGWWWIAEFIPKPYWKQVPPVGAAGGGAQKPKWVHRLGLPLGRRRKIEEGATLHQSVLDRMHAPEAKYAPKNLPLQFETEPDAQLLMPSKERSISARASGPETTSGSLGGPP